MSRWTNEKHNLVKTKFIRICTLAIASFSFVLFGCDDGGDDIDDGRDDDTKITLTVNNTPIHFPAEGGSRDVSVTTNATDWNVVSNRPWCTVTKGTGKFTVSALPNESVSPPDVATLTVTASGKTEKVTIEVTQSAADIPEEPYIEAVINTAFFREDGGIQGIAVMTNQDVWNVSSDQPWCGVTKLDGGINIEITEYWTGAVPRSATVTLTAGESTFALEVIQDPVAELSVNTNQGNTDISFPYEGGTIVVNVTTNVSRWTVWKEQDWLSVDIINSKSFSITAGTKAAGESRPFTELIIQANGRTHILTVDQDEPTSSGNDYQYEEPIVWD